jgi:Protein of unknown function (DUF2735)
MTTPSTGTAKIYAFPPRGRFALRAQDGALGLPANVKLPEGAEFSHQGSGWYHEEAVQDALKAELSRKN